jgi:hypothetical protein
VSLSPGLKPALFVAMPPQLVAIVVGGQPKNKGLSTTISKADAVATRPVPLRVE